MQGSIKLASWNLRFSNHTDTDVPNLLYDFQGKGRLACRCPAGYLESCYVNDKVLLKATGIKIKT